MSADGRLRCHGFAALHGEFAVPHGEGPAPHGATTASGCAGRRFRAVHRSVCPARTDTPHAPRLAALAPTAGGRAPGFDFLDRLRR